MNNIVVVFLFRENCDFALNAIVMKKEAKEKYSEKRENI